MRVDVVKANARLPETCKQAGDAGALGLAVIDIADLQAVARELQAKIEALIALPVETLSPEQLSVELRRIAGK